MMNIGTRDERLVIVFKPLLLMVTGCLLLLFRESALLFDAISVLASYIAIRDVYRFITRPTTLRFSSLFAASILLGYGLGSVIYLLGYGTLQATQYQYWAPQNFYFTQQGLSFAFAGCVMASALLYVCAMFEKPILIPQLLEKLEGIKPERIVWLGTLIAAVAFATGKIGYMGAVTTNDHVTVLGDIANLIVPGLIPYTLLLLTKKRDPEKRFALIVCLLFQCAILLMFGRRYLLYVIVLSAISLSMKRLFVHGWSSNAKQRKKGNVLRNVMISALTVVALYYGFEFFMALRLATWELGPKATTYDLIQTAFSLLSGSGDQVRQFLAQNVVSRPFILSYLAGLTDITNRIPLHGRELLYALEMSIPSVLFPGKSALPVNFMTMVHPYYGIVNFDGPNSALVAGYDDFGFVGEVLYPIGVFFLYHCAYRFLRRIKRDSAICTFVLFAILFEILYVQQALSTPFTTIRDIIIIVIATSFIMRFPVTRIRKYPGWNQSTLEAIAKLPRSSSSNTAK